jgi:hypothetical protein
VIYSYDIFYTAGYEWFIKNPEEYPTGSIFSKYLEVNRDFLDSLVITPGDLLQFGYRGGPIEIMFIDLAKTWELNTYVVQNFFSKLIPGKSLILQQDYIHFHEYWIHLTMEYFHEYFEFLETMWGGTAVFKYVKKIPDELLRTNLQALSVEEKSALLERERARRPAPIQEMIKAVHANMLLDAGRLEEAQKMFDRIDCAKKTHDPILEISELVTSNRELLRQTMVAKLNAAGRR